MADAKEPLELHRTGSRLQVRMVGAQEADGVVRLEAFNKLIEKLLKTLAAVENEIADERVTTYRVLAFQYGSPGELLLEAAPKVPTAMDRGREVFPRFTEHLTAINDGRVPEGIAHTTLEQLQALSGLRDYYELMEFQNDGAPAVIDQRTSPRIKKLLGNVLHSRGNMRGRLDAVNIHADPSIATLYPLVGPSKVRCLFNRSNFPNIGEHLGQAVEVSGTLRFHAGQPHPFEIDMDRITPLTSGRITPSIVGSMPNLTEGLTTLEYLRMLRDGEEAA